MSENYSKDGSPIRCYKCGSTDIESKIEDRIDHIVCEESFHCGACQTRVGYWAYGYFDGPYDAPETEQGP